jgi:hypothetical protein
MATYKVCAIFSAATGSLSANSGSTRSTSDDDDLALEAEEVLELGCLGNGNHCNGICWVGGCWIRV